MKILYYFIWALWCLWRTKLRSILSTLWIVIWITSVTLMLALGEWVKQKMLESLTNSNDVIVINRKESYWEGQMWPDWKPKAKEQQLYSQIKDIFNQESIDNLTNSISNIRGTLPIINVYPWNIKFAWKDLYSSFMWVGQDFLRLKNVNILYGYWFTKSNFENSDRVVIVWYNSIQDSFDGKNPVWKEINIWWYTYSIIWVMDKSKDYQLNYSMIVPITTAIDRMGWKWFSKVEIYVQDIKHMEKTKKDVLYLLMKLSLAQSPQDAKFVIESNDKMIEEINKSIGQFQLFLWGIAWISLFVWWIWIMNIMLVSVVERTREIWIRKAIWAKWYDILIQFLIESIVISVLWCVVAFGISFLWAYLITKFSPLPVKISTNVLLFSSSVSVGMWIIFGILPAWKASKLKPIDALRFE